MNECINTCLEDVGRTINPHNAAQMWLSVMHSVFYLSECGIEISATFTKEKFNCCFKNLSVRCDSKTELFHNDDTKKYLLHFGMAQVS